MHRRTRLRGHAYDVITTPAEIDHGMGRMVCVIGDVNPNGELPVSLARDVGQLPMFYNRKPSARRGYRFDDTKPLWPFDHRLSCTTFSYAAPRRGVGAARMAPNGRTTLTVDVTNSGARAGDDVVQLCVRDHLSRVTRPVQELLGLQRVALRAKETRSVRFDVDSRTLGCDGQEQVGREPGAFDLMVGGISAQVKKVVLEGAPQRAGRHRIRTRARGAVASPSYDPLRVTRHAGGGRQRCRPLTGDMSDIVSSLTEHLAGHYRIERELGAGGMATVFLAHDLKHDRDVAIKVLHPDLGAALGGERFLTEIRTTARLQHPHILPLLDSGEAGGLLYYVMPLVTGETLRVRLERERLLPIHDAVLVAREVADALGYAHGLGVIHRDIKPENILLQNGHALVADFGIALAVQTAGGARMTQTGLSLGTPQYMSPEQAMGERTIDARSDIYALGAVTYEMLVGEAPFTGPSVQAIVARLLSEEPRSLGKQRKAVPEHVEFAVQRALEKLPADRWATAREYADALQETTATSAARGATRTPRARDRAGARWGARLRDPVVLALASLAVATSFAAGWTLRSGTTAPEERPVRFAIPTARNGSGTALGFSNLAISRDGQLMVYVGQHANGRNGLMLRPMDDIHSRTLPGTEGADSPFFSPDGRWVGFIRGNQIYKTAVGGGTPQLLATAPGTFNGASWSSTGAIVTSGNIGLFLIPESGGPSRQLSKSDKSRDEVNQDAPVVLDEAKGVLYASWRGSDPAQVRIAFASLETGETTILDLLGVSPLGVIDGTLIYVTIAGSIMAVPFDESKLQVKGRPVQVGSDVYVNNTSGLARAALSRTGTLFYESGTHVSHVVRTDLRGTSQMVLSDPREYAYPRYSPDGSRFALTVGTSDQRDVWVYDLASGAPTRLTTQSPTNERPEWTPDGKRVLYRTDRSGRASIWMRAADLSAEAQPLLSREGYSYFEAVISPDGHYIAYQLDTAGADVYYQALQGDTTPKPVANSTAIEIMPRISPDGRWIAFVTDESGLNQVVVQPFPGPGARTQLSTAGGTEPVWSRDGTRVFYRAEGRMIAARVRTAPAFGVIGRDTLFIDEFAHSTNPHANFDASPDGIHLLMLKPVSEDEMIVVANWSAGLKARMGRKPGS